MRHAFVHFDLNTSDFPGVRRFYEALFDWDFVDVDMGGGAPQAQMVPSSGPSGGLQPTHSRGARSQWVPYVAVDDLRAMLARVREAGGAVIQDYVEVPGLGAQAIVQDPGGTQLGLWEMAAELLPAPAPAPVPEIVEAEVIEDVEVEEAPAPEVVVDAPAEGRGKKRGGRRTRAALVAETAETPEVVVETPEPEKKPAEAPAVASKGKARSGKKQIATSEPTAAAIVEDAVVEPPAPVVPTKRGPKKTAKKTVVETQAPAPSPVPAAKKTAKKPVVEESAPVPVPASKKTAKKPAVVEKPARVPVPAAKKTAKKPPVIEKLAPVPVPAAKKTAKKPVVEKPVPAPAPAVTKPKTSKKPAPAPAKTSKRPTGRGRR